MSNELSQKLNDSLKVKKVAGGSSTVKNTTSDKPEEAEANKKALASKSGRKEEEEDEEDDLLLLLPCWHSVARKLRVASARDAQKEVLRRAGWETCVCVLFPQKFDVF